MTSHLSVLLTAVRAGVFAALSLLGASNASAVTALPTQGVCAFIGSFQYPFAYTKGIPAPNGFGLNVMGTLDFSQKIIRGNIVIINPGIRSNPNGAGGILPMQQQSTFSGAFTIGTGPFSVFGQNWYVLSSNVTIAGDSQPTTLFTWNVIPVNGGNTLLMQLAAAPDGNADAGVAAVCQF